MPTVISTRTFTNVAPDVLNATINAASIDFRNYVPYCTPGDVNSIRTIGNTLLNSPNLMNEFIRTLINLTGKFVLWNSLFSNPLAPFVRGKLDYGDSIEEIFVEMVHPHEYDPAAAAARWMQREIPDVKTAFHVINYEKFYKVTIQPYDLQRAFLNESAFSDFYNKLFNQMYEAAQYDEYLMIKYLIAKRALNGELSTQVVADGTDPKEFAKAIKAVSNKFTFKSRDYNPAGVLNNSPKDYQYLLVTADYDAELDVEALAYAFNMDKIDWSGHRILIDTFACTDITRLNELLALVGQDAISSADNEALASIKCALVDRRLSMIYNNIFVTESQRNGEGLYNQGWLHCWMVYSTSPFANGAIFTATASTVTSVTVTPPTATVAPGATVQLSVAVVASAFAPKSVTWEVKSGDATVTADGIVTIGSTTGTVKVRATSTADSTKYAEATITVTSGN